MNLNNLRREYVRYGLDKSNINSSPFTQFGLWMEQAIKADIYLPNAMSLATADDDGLSIRTVLLKHFDEQGLVFFSNYHSKKARQIEQNPQAALLFSWLDLERQIKITGKVEKISAAKSSDYFASRPRDSQLAAWASRQSVEILDRQALLDKFDSVKQKFGGQKVPLPDFWGGYRLLPQTFEFWQGRENRLHDRFLYQKQQQQWLIKRLAP